jgi:multiple sugar transport system permease protein/raffinose/stachyose/melibiose transport system permease protein
MATITSPIAAFDQALGEKHKRQRRRPSRMRRGEARGAWLMAAPALLLLIVFLVVPAVMAFGLAFTNARLASPLNPEFVGLDNFVRAFTADPVFPRSVINTLYFAGVVVPVHSTLALVLALLVNARVRGRNVFRTIYFLPVVTSLVAMSVLWRFMYQQDGLINSMLSTFSGSAIQGNAWLSDPTTAMPAVMLMSIWQAVGFHMVIWLAGLQTIPQELYEAATVDGASTWQRFRFVTWPGLRPTLVIVVVTETIGALGVFAQINLMTEGGPLNSTSTIIFHAVRMGVNQQNVGYGAALSLVFFLMVLAISLLQTLWTREKGGTR